ncbi:hypothetical protein [Alicyclobacillus dauci]|uniref:Uncharacterized protein n=1 Tax=Alicyclobacillus dauci TaxID=1475485 RepID=A0ABY6Z6R4_9BACL|nr:hypothetical protein [Alicyclobacillus dauci]WAH38588.1 hypothetical protein NZD86_08950 [Alicyclobacillus dauci]
MTFRDTLTVEQRLYELEQNVSHLHRTIATSVMGEISRLENRIRNLEAQLGIPSSLNNRKPIDILLLLQMTSHQRFRPITNREQFLDAYQQCMSPSVGQVSPASNEQ